MRKIVAALAGAATATLLVSGAGLAAANASSARSSSSGTEHFSLMTTQPSATKYVIIASGLFTGGGTDVETNTFDTATLPGGTFRISHPGSPHIISESVNPATCLAAFKASAKFTLGSGTGKYKGISGSGTAIVAALQIAPRSHGTCNPNANPLYNEQTITATAHVKL
jgi:hypothetical protein